MPLIEAKIDLVFILEHLNSADTLIAHVQRMIPYLIFDRASQALEKRRQRAAYYGTAFQIMESIKKARKHHGEFELLVKWLGFDSRHDETWETIGTVKEDMLGVPEEFLHASDNSELKWRL